MVKKQYLAVRKKIEPAYTKYLKYDGINADIIGDIQVADNTDISNFSKNNYLEIPNFVSFVEKTEIYVGFKLTTLGISRQSLIDGPAVAGRNIRLYINSSNKLQLAVSTTSAHTTYNVNITGATTLALNTDYIVRVTYGPIIGYILELSTDDGLTFTQEAVSATYVLPYMNGNVMWIGKAPESTSTYFFHGVIYGDKTKVVKDSVAAFDLMKFTEGTAEDYIEKIEYPQSSVIKYYNFYNRHGSYNRNYLLDRKISINNQETE